MHLKHDQKSSATFRLDVNKGDYLRIRGGETRSINENDIRNRVTVAQNRRRDNRVSIEISLVDRRL